MEDKKWSIVFTTNIPFQAEMVKQILENNGIETVIVDKQDSSYPTIGEAEVYVLPGSEVAAKKLIKDIEL